MNHPARSSRLPWLAVGGLVVLLAVLAGLQVRWLRQVAAAERQRVEAAVANGLAGFTRELDAEVSRAWLVFHRVGETPGPAELAARLAWWRDAAPSAELLGELVLVTDGDPPTAERLAAMAGDGGWRAAPPAVAASAASTVADAGQHERLHAGHLHRGGRRGSPPGGVPPSGSPPGGVPPFPALRPSLPGLVVPLAPGRALVVGFDRDHLRRDLLPSLVRRHLEPALGGGLEARVTVAETGEEVWATSPDLAGAFEWEAPAFQLLPPDELARLAASLGLLPALADGEDARVARGDRFDRDAVFRRGRHAAVAALFAGRPGWIVAVRPAAGSLDAALARARRGNAALAFGILVLLALAAIALVVWARRAQELARRQLELTAAVSHELRTPLAAIRSLADNLADGVVQAPAQARLYGEQIARQGERLTGLVEQVLALAAHEARGPRERRPVDVAALVAEAVEEATAGAPDATVEVDAAGVPPIAGDPLALRRALHNLVSNALKHGGAPPWARIEASAPGSGAEVRLAVADRGPGVPAAERERLFEPFYRGDLARAAQTPGVGLGLHLVRRIAESHGGRVEVRSGPAGSVFTLVLPRAREDAP